MQEPTLIASPTSEPPTAPWYEPFAVRPATTLLCVALPLALGLGFSLLLPAKYLAHGKIILPNSGLGRSAAFASVAGSLGISSDTGSLPMFAAILRSEAMLHHLSSQTGLSRKALRKMISIRDDPKSNTIEVIAVGTNRNAILHTVKESFVELNTIASRVNLPQKEDQTSRLSATLANRQRDLARSEVTLKAFLQTAKTLPGGGISLREGATSDGTGGADAGPGTFETIQPGLGYKQQLSALEIELQKLDSSVEAIRATSKAQASSPPLDLPPVKLWADKIADAETRLAQLRPRYRTGSPEIVEAEKSLAGILADRKRDVERYLESVRASLTGPAQTLSVTRAGVQRQVDEIKKYVDAAPEETIQYLRLLRGVGSNEMIVNQIRLLYEKARVEQSSDPNTWAVLDAPEIDDEYDSRNLTRNATLGVVAGIVLAYGLGSRRTVRRSRTAA